MSQFRLAKCPRFIVTLPDVTINRNTTKIINKLNQLTNNEILSEENGKILLLTSHVRSNEKSLSLKVEVICSLLLRIVLCRLKYKYIYRLNSTIILRIISKRCQLTLTIINIKSTYSRERKSQEDIEKKRKAQDQLNKTTLINDHQPNTTPVSINTSSTTNESPKVRKVLNTTIPRHRKPRSGLAKKLEIVKNNEKSKLSHLILSSSENINLNDIMFEVKKWSDNVRSNDVTFDYNDLLNEFHYRIPVNSIEDANKILQSIKPKYGVLSLEDPELIGPNEMFRVVFYCHSLVFSNSNDLTSDEEITKEFIISNSISKDKQFFSFNSNSSTKTISVYCKKVKDGIKLLNLGTLGVPSQNNDTFTIRSLSSVFDIKVEGYEKVIINNVSPGITKEIAEKYLETMLVKPIFIERIRYKENNLATSKMIAIVQGNETIIRIQSIKLEDPNTKAKWIIKKDDSSYKNNHDE